MKQQLKYSLLTSGLFMVVCIGAYLLSTHENINIPQLSSDRYLYTPMSTLQNSKVINSLSQGDIPKDLALRSQLAGDPMVNPKILEKLVYDKQRMIRRAVAVNPATPVNTLLYLTKDKEPSVRGLLAQCNRIPQVLRVLANDKILAIRQAVASNPYADEQTLLTLSQDSNKIIQSRISLHNNASFELVSMIELNN